MPGPMYAGAYPPVQWPVPVPPPPKRGIGLGVFIAVIIVVALVSCGVGVVGGLLIRPARTTGAAPTPSQSSIAALPSQSPLGATIGPGDGAALLAKILPVPPGAKEYDVSGSTNGVMTLDQLIHEGFGDDQTEAARLKTRGFTVAAQRNWTGADGVDVQIQLIGFAADTGAESHVLGQIGAFGRDSAVTGTFALPVPHGNGYEKSALDSNGDRHMILLGQDGPVVIVIFLFTPGAFDRVAATDLMKRQYSALAGHP
jgi:hypothetical protein